MPKGRLIVLRLVAIWHCLAPSLFVLKQWRVVSSPRANVGFAWA